MMWNHLTTALAESTMLARLCFASLELLLLTVLLSCVLRCWRCSSPRLVSMLWLIVLTKPALSLALGTPIPLMKLPAPAMITQVVAQDALSHEGEPTSMATLHSVAPETPVLLQPTSDLQPSPASPGISPEILSPVIGRVAPSTLLVAVWLVGVALFAARYLFFRWRIWRIVRAGTPVPEEFRLCQEEIAREIGLGRCPDMRATDRLHSPALVGVLRPVLLLPCWMVQRVWSANAEWALRHELSHCKWFDPVALFVRDVSAILFHFHPAVWWAARRHSEAIEVACDRDSLRDPAEAPSYAEALCEILTKIRDRETGFGIRAELAMARRGRTARRIATLLDGRPTYPLTKRTAATAALLALTTFTFGFGMTPQAGRPEGPPQDHGQDSQSARPPSLFFLGPTGGQFMLLARSAKGKGNIWGRSHDSRVYEELFEDQVNPFRRRPEDELVLLLTLNGNDRVPERYQDLLPSPWPDTRARLEQGDTVEESGSARDMKILVLAAPNRAKLKVLIARSTKLATLLGAPISGGMNQTPDVFVMGGDRTMFQEVVDNTSRGTHDKTGRAHDETVYDEIFSGTPNHYDRSDGDLMVLLFSLEKGDTLPREYHDLLPKPWAQIEAAMKEGKTVDLHGEARGLKVVVLAAPTRSALVELIGNTPAFASYRPGGKQSSMLLRDLPTGSRYVVSFDEEDRRTAQVRLEVPAADGVLGLSMSPGARHVHGGYSHFLRELEAADANGKSAAVTVHGDYVLAVDLGEEPILVEYKVRLEHDASPWPEGGPDEAPYATADDVFWTGRALFLFAECDGVEVEFKLPREWKVSTPWEPVAGRANTFRVADEQELTESFLVAGHHAQYLLGGGDTQVLLAVGHGVGESGAELRDSVQDTLDSCNALFGSAPPGRKLLVANWGQGRGMNGGVFRNSISLLTDRRFDEGGRGSWAPFVAHEVIHLWNGGTGLRSGDRDYWFSEGFTEYYAFVLSTRQGFIDRDAFLERVKGACQAYLEHAGSISLRDSQRHSNVRAMQYDGGFVAALMLDLRLRRSTGSRYTLDDLMRAMYSSHSQATYSMKDVAVVAADLAGSNLDGYFERYVGGTEVLPLEQDLAHAGLWFESRITEVSLDRQYAIHEVLHIRSLTGTHDGLVVRRSADFGYRDGDRLVAIDDQLVATFAGLQYVLTGSDPGDTVSLKINREGNIITMPLILGGRENPPVQRRTDVRLRVNGDTALLDAILSRG